MACPKCSPWRTRILKPTRRSPSVRRAFRTSSGVRDDLQAVQTPSETSTSSDSPPLGLHILQHRSGLTRSPNSRIRPPIHDVELATRLGTRYSRPVVGGLEWQTSTYHYNKQTAKTLPVLAQTTNKLLEAYAQIRPMLLDRSGKPVSTPGMSVAERRKSPDKMYVSSTSVRDYGSKVVIDAFVYDAADAAAKEEKTRTQRRASRPKRGPAGPGQGSGGRRSGGRPPSSGAQFAAQAFRGPRSPPSGTSSAPQRFGGPGLPPRGDSSAPQAFRGPSFSPSSQGAPGEGRSGGFRPPTREIFFPQQGLDGSRPSPRRRRGAEQGRSEDSFDPLTNPDPFGDRR